MPVVRYNNTSNTNASQVTRRAQGRAIYANSLVNQKSLEQNCLNRVAAGPAATTSFDGAKYIDQRIGNIFTTPVQASEIVLTSPCAVPSVPPLATPIVYPNYELTCSDPLGIQIMATGSFTSFTFTTTSLGAGVLEFQFFLNENYVSSQLVVLGSDSNLITPPAGIDEVRYVFKCNPINVDVFCAAVDKVLQWTNPYQFTLTDGGSTTLTLVPHNGGSPVTSTINSGVPYTPTPSYGWDSWDISPC